MDDGEERETRLRVVICGDVDSGKSTLIGGLLHGLGQILQDHLRTIERESAHQSHHATSDQTLDLSLAVDGLQDEKEQGITIDVAYRTLRVGQRQIILADAPGHAQYTRNMAVAASTAHAAIVLVDAVMGITEQAMRHTRIAHLMGVRSILLVVNKMDVVLWNVDRFTRVLDDYRARTRNLGLTIQALGVCARTGQNVTFAHPGAACGTPGTHSVVQWLERISADTNHEVPPCMPVQVVLRSPTGERLYGGTISRGRIHPGDRLHVLPSRQIVTVRGVKRADEDAPHADAGQCVTLSFHEHCDISRGDVLCAPAAQVEVASQWRAHLVVVGSTALIAQRVYWIKLHHKTIAAHITSIRHIIEPSTGAKLAATSLAPKSIAVVHLSTDVPLPFNSYEQDHSMGGFILIDPMSRDTVAAGMIDHALRRDANIHPHALAVTQAARAASKSQHALCLWITGLSGSGKSTLANALDQRLHAMGRHTYVLDGDNVRHGLNRDLGFTPSDRAENVRRIAEVARLMVDAGLVVLVSSISPYRAERECARQLFKAGEFIEVFMNTPLAECERRDPKGLYAKARAQQLPDFTGVSSPYESPVSPEIRVNEQPMDSAVRQVLDWLAQHETTQQQELEGERVDD